jgi:putative sterol carrier protein
LVVYGSLSNTKDQNSLLTLDPVDGVIKENDFVKGKKEIDLGRNFDPNPTKTYRYVVFIDFFQGKVDPFRGFAVKVGEDGKSDVAKYLKGALAVKDKKPGERLRFFFDYLDNSEMEVSMDALKEFGNADYKDYQEMAKKLPPDKIAAWLRDDKTPSYRYGLYASLLGHCGKPEHADLLRSKLEDKENPVMAGLDGIIAAYTMLRPKEGHEYIEKTVKDTKKDFMYRYACLRALRFCWQYRTDLINQKDIAECALQLIDQKDIADLAIEDLRKWQRWECAEKILALQQSEAYQKTPIIRRAVLRYALRCKGSQAIDAYVVDQRKKDPDGVKNAEELLELTEPVVATPPPVPAPGGK